WSPDQISGRLAKDGVAFVSHERIYQHVWKDKKDGGKLYLHLRHSGKKYNKLAKLPDKSADSVVRACARVLLPLADRIETITYDNGKEFASHVEIATS